MFQNESVLLGRLVLAYVNTFPNSEKSLMYDRGRQTFDSQATMACYLFWLSIIESGQMFPDYFMS